MISSSLIVTSPWAPPSAIARSRYRQHLLSAQPAVSGVAAVVSNVRATRRSRNPTCKVLTVQKKRKCFWQYAPCRLWAARACRRSTYFLCTSSSLLLLAKRKRHWAMRRRSAAARPLSRQPNTCRLPLPPADALPFFALLSPVFGQSLPVAKSEPLAGRF